jgi:hypothetical protein
MGMAASGAMDANAFCRSTLTNAHRLPPPESITWEGVLHEHYYETGTTAKRVEPSFSLVSSSDPLSGCKECWLTLGLNSCYDGRGIQQKGRLPCNIVFVIDVSGSMGSCFRGHSGVSKLQAAKDAVSGILPLLRADDTVAILAFDTQCTVEAPLTALCEHDATKQLETVISSLQTRGGTCFMAGFEGAMQILQEAENGLMSTPVGWTPRIDEELPAASRDATQFLKQTLQEAENGLMSIAPSCVEHALSFLNFGDIARAGGSTVACDVSRQAFTETRIFFMTDMNINQGNKDAASLMKAIEDAATQHGVMTTIVGIGIDFDVTLTDHLACVRGANYFTVHSTDEFLTQMTEEVDYLMAPLAFDLKVEIASSIDEDNSNSQVSAVHVYGAPEPAKNGPRPAGTLARINSFFPSSTNEQGQTKGSLIICRLDHVPSSGHLSLKTSYNPRNGDPIQCLYHQAEVRDEMDAAALKGIALVRYVNAIRCYLSDMQSGRHVASTSIGNGITHPTNPCDSEHPTDPGDPCDSESESVNVGIKIPGKRQNQKSCLRSLLGRKSLPRGDSDADIMGPDHHKHKTTALMATYSDVFERLGSYLQDVENKLKCLGDTDADVSKWREKLVELRQGCLQGMNKSQDGTEAAGV